jgi:hypothetical protein
MNFQCPKCLWIHQLDAGDRRPPPWCKKCGVDLKPDEYREVAGPPSAPAWAPPRAFGEDEVTQVTGTGGKPWLNASKPAENEADYPATAQPPTRQPMTAADPDQEREYGLAKAGGVLLVAIAGLWAGNIWSFVKSAGKAEGRVVISNDYFDAYKNQRTWQTEPISVVQYDVIGKIHEFPEPSLEAGTTVPVVFPLDEPHRGRLGDPMSLYRWPMLLGLVGLSVFGGSLVATRTLSHKRRRSIGDSASC